MLPAVFARMRGRKYVVSAVVFFLVFSLIYVLLDRLNGGYARMAEEYGVFLVVLNVFLNVIMAAGSALLMNLSTAYVSLSGREGKGTFLGSAAVFFGMLTYGCTSCVVAFFAAIGITLSVAVLPLAGLPYKLVSLALVLLGLAWLLIEIRRGRCRMKKKPDPEESGPAQ